MKFKHAYTVLLLLVVSPVLKAGIDQTEAYKDDALQHKTLDKSSWKSKSKGYDYSDEHRPEPKEPTERNAPKIPSFNFGKVAQIILYGIIILLLAFIIYRIIRSVSLSRKKKIKDTHEITFENLEEHIHETELERFLREALETQNYEQAVRVLFLMVLKAASEKELIKWKKDKTNGTYLLEMYSHPTFPTFKALTLIFERVWYGKHPLDLSSYKEIEERYQSYLNAIAHG